MSSMELFVGEVTFCDPPLIPIGDTDEFYDMQQADGGYYVQVFDQTYFVKPIVHTCEQVSRFIAQPPNRLIVCYFYNGRAGINEALEAALRKRFKEVKGTK